MKRKIKYLLFIIFCNIFIVNVYATSINASASKSQIQEGQTVKVNITVSSEETLGSWGFSVGYDSSVLQYVSSDLESGLTSVGVGNGSMKNKTYTLTFKGKKSGTGSVSISSPWVYSWAEKTMKVSTKGASIKVTSASSSSSSNTKSNTTSNKSKNESANNNLSSLSIEKYDLNPKFDKNTTNYDVSVPNEVREIKVNAKAEDSKASVSGTGNIKLNEGKNKVSVVVKAENGNRKTYTINVNVKDKNPIIINVDGEDYTVVQKKEELNSPNNYKETTTTINGMEVPALTSDITNFTLVGLTDKNGKTNLYIYSDDNYKLYNEYKFAGISLYLKEPSKDKMIDKLEEIEITVDDNKIKAYKLEDNIYPLLYGINLDSGEENWYTYEESENTLQKFEVGGKNGSGDVKLATSVASGTDKFKNLSIILGGISGILFIFLIIAGIRLSMRKKDVVEDVNDEPINESSDDFENKVLPIENQTNEVLPKEENIVNDNIEKKPGQENLEEKEFSKKIEEVEKKEEVQNNEKDSLKNIEEVEKEEKIQDNEKSLDNAKSSDNINVDVNPKELQEEKKDINLEETNIDITKLDVEKNKTEN